MGELDPLQEGWLRDFTIHILNLMHLEVYASILCIGKWSGKNIVGPWNLQVPNEAVNLLKTSQIVFRESWKAVKQLKINMLCLESRQLIETSCVSSLSSSRTTGTPSRHAP
jgi:hypothetical protein